MKIQPKKNPANNYAFGVTDYLSGLIAAGKESVARQYMPDAREDMIAPEEMADPIGDEAHMPVKGIVHRYPDRVLLKLTHVCAVYCRFCFRRDMVGPGAGQVLKPDERAAALDYIHAHSDVWEVILTGGDPFVLSPRQIGETLDAIEAIDHVKVIRIHTRLPAADPDKITDELCAALKRDKALYVAIHINHPDEVTPQFESAVKKLLAAGCVLVSQSVLLKGVNDDPAILEDFFRKLTALRVRPYYLHHPDLARGTKHFRLPLRRGQAIMKTLLGRLSGIARPAYVLDIPGGFAKIPAESGYLVPQSGDETLWTVADPSGRLHAYRESYDET